jgi:antitoxin (DNA-binding transcriptional repressor) of toxin-antitoxin stability system
MQKIPAARFKSQCLALLNQIAANGRAVVVTKRGKPIVQISRVEFDEDEIFGFLVGKGRIVGDVENAIPTADWMPKNNPTL